MTAKPWMRWHVDRWRKSIRVMAMSLAARGAFFELLQAAWERDGKLPNTPEIFWRLARASSPAEFDSVKDRVLAMFTPTEDGQFLVNDTLSDEYENAEAYLADLSQKRRAAANASWEKRRARQSKTANEMQPGVQLQSKPLLSSSSSSSSKRETQAEQDAAELPPLALAQRVAIELCLPRDHGLLDVIASAIQSCVKYDAMGNDQAVTHLITEGNAAIKRGEQPTRFWFSDGKWRKPAEPKIGRGYVEFKPRPAVSQ